VNAQTGSTTWSSAYDPFGEATTTGTAPVALGFQSMYTDPTTGLVDMRARQYNPGTGTFTTADTLSGDPTSVATLNRYLYGNGDPVNHIDPDGRADRPGPGRGVRDPARYQPRRGRALAAP